MARTREWQENEAWPQAWPEDREIDDPFVESRPMVNPYAVIALVAALLALFPVAIVFGLIAFGHPKGKAMATFAVLIGIAEAAAVAAVVVLTGSSLSDTLASGDATTTTSSAAAEPTLSAGAPPADLPSARPEAVTTTVEAPVVHKGASCTAGQLGMLGTGVDGGTLLCLEAAGADGGHQWSGPYHVGTGVYEPGETCDETISKSGRTADGRAVVCESQGASGAAWVLWTS
ncbi:hypothetical protein [Nocardia farcinica]|uniref:hypothetical protein n=1 Tax=Nocardia farcinica TaxID=37329 RepID=UPI002458AF4D|nr:hypothetical protein [Nocardia farcinica]